MTSEYRSKYLQGLRIDALRLGKVHKMATTRMMAKFPVFVPEGTLAIRRVLDKLYPGKWEATPIKFKDFFGEHTIDPMELRVQVDVDKFEPSLYNGVTVEGIGQLTVGVYGDEQNMPGVQLNLSAENELQKKKFMALAEEIEAYLKANPLYKGKTIMLSWPDPRVGESWDYDSAPKFFDVRKFDPATVVLAPHVRRAVDKALITPIAKSDYCREAGVGLKRGILLAGPPGNGKTLLATMTARTCSDHGWTFVYLKSGAVDLKTAYNYVSRWAPVVLFVEDVDRAVKGDRTKGIDNILNTLDGVDTKNNEVILVLSTNDLQSIRPEMLRPGRIDAIVKVPLPGPNEIQRLIKQYAGPQLNPTSDLIDVADALKHQNAATVREVVERARLGAIWEGTLPRDIELDSKSLLEAAREVTNQTKDEE